MKDKILSDQNHKPNPTTHSPISGYQYKPPLVRKYLVCITRVSGLVREQDFGGGGVEFYRRYAHAGVYVFKGKIKIYQLLSLKHSRNMF